mmetsp:Transcript_18597/g.33791  ORF Transcript_18597/g.33791 Transcript_18597/m.33791 type:complete len:85 (+) Transcript_18597:706-960(+)
MQPKGIAVSKMTRIYTTRQTNDMHEIDMMFLKLGSTFKYILDNPILSKTLNINTRPPIPAQLFWKDAKNPDLKFNSKIEDNHSG